MLQEQEPPTWDLRSTPPEASTGLKIYILFLLVVCVVSTIKLIRIWRAVPPFRLSRRANDPSYLHLLQVSGTSLKQWVSFTFLAWGIVASTTLTDVCNGLLAEKSEGRYVIISLLQDFSTTLSMALLVVLFVFLARWHVLKRIDRLRT
jgi:hypothetical protein